MGRRKIKRNKREKRDRERRRGNIAREFTEERGRALTQWK